MVNKIKISHPQIVRYETKDVQPPADLLSRLADILDVSIDYLVNGNTSDKIEQTLKDANLIKQFKKIDQLLEEGKKQF
jgi:transcriptional regulator with XRE-family HTH domain